MGVREQQPELQELFKNNIPVYSYSKLNSFYGCLYNYYLTYIAHEKALDNIYSCIGGNVHDSIEACYAGDMTLQEGKNRFITCVEECEKKGIKFPEKPPTTKINYVNNIKLFFDNYKMLNLPMKSEVFVLYRLPRVENPKEEKDYYHIQMYADAIVPTFDEEGNPTGVRIIDWKTSSKFDKEKEQEVEKQLLLYKLGVEQYLHLPVTSIQWCMLKYCVCCYMTKGSKNKSPEKKVSAPQERCKAIKWFKNKIVKDLIKDCEMDEMEAELLFGRAVNENSLDCMPDLIKERYWIEDYYKECNFDDAKMEETKQWIKDTINKIESIDNVDGRKPKTKEELALVEPNFPCPEDMEKQSFFCNNLCGRHTCKYMLQHREQYKEEQNKKENDTPNMQNQLESFFSGLSTQNTSMTDNLGNLNLDEMFKNL